MDPSSIVIISYFSCGLLIQYQLMPPKTMIDNRAMNMPVKRPLTDGVKNLVGFMPLKSATSL